MLGGSKRYVRSATSTESAFFRLGGITVAVGTTITDGAPSRVGQWRVSGFE